MSNEQAKQAKNLLLELNVWRKALSEALSRKNKDRFAKNARVEAYEQLLLVVKAIGAVLMPDLLDVHLAMPFGNETRPPSAAGYITSLVKQVLEDSGAINGKPSSS